MSILLESEIAWIWESLPSWQADFAVNGSDLCNNITRTVGGGIGSFSGVFPNGVSWQIQIEEIDPSSEQGAPEIDTSDLAQSIKNAVDDSLQYHRGLTMVQRMIFEALFAPQMSALHGLNAIEQEAWDRSTAAGQRAAEYYAGQVVAAGGEFWDDPAAGVGLYLSAHWTPDTAPWTAGALSLKPGWNYAKGPLAKFFGPKGPIFGTSFYRGRGNAGILNRTYIRVGWSFYQSTGFLNFGLRIGKWHSDKYFNPIRMAPPP